jgi:undecaprenyl-diphosphatase
MKLRLRPALLVAINYGLFIVLLIGVATNAPFITAIDHAGQRLADWVTSPSMTRFMISITQTANTWSLITITAFIVMVLTITHRWRWSVFVAGAAAMASLLNIVIKFIIQRARPTLPHLIEQGGYSFPSGHSDSSIAVYGALILFLIVTFRPSWQRHVAVILLTLFIVTIGFSRIYVHVHYPTDVLAGFFLGWGDVCVLWLIARRTWLKNSVVQVQPRQL